MASRKIHEFDGYPGTSDAMMKSKNKLKEYRSAEGEGGMSDYPDTTEDIHRDQEHGARKAGAQKMKPGYRQ